MVLLFILHIFLSFEFNNFNWLGAFGAILTIYSLLLTLTDVLYPNLKEDIKHQAVKQKYGEWIYLPEDGGSFAELISEEFAVKVNKTNDEAVCNKYSRLFLAHIITLIGTILWAYSGFIYYRQN